MIKAVAFDMDGVLVDTEPYYADAFKSFFLRHGVRLTREECDDMVGSNSARNYERIVRKHFPQWSFETYYSRYRAFLKGRPIDYRARLFPDVTEALRRLKEEGYRIALASSTALDQIEVMLDACGLRPCFDLVLSGKMFAQSKPHPEIYIRTAERLGLAPGDCAAVEDSLPGIQAAADAGMTVIARRDPRFAVDLRRADYIVESVSRVPEIVQRHNRR